MAPSWTHLIRFIAEEDGQVHYGQVDVKQFPDAGIAALNGEKITAKLIQGSVFDGIVTDKVLHVAWVSLDVLEWESNSAQPETASLPRWNRRCPNNSLLGAELPRPCARGQHANSRRAGSFRKTAHCVERATPGKDQCTQDCTGWLE